MKYITTILFCLVLLSANAQESAPINYGDSSITLTLTQRTAYWVGGYVKNRFEWSARNAPTQLRNFIGSGTREDSVFTTSLPAKYLFGAIDLLLSQPLQVAYSDYRSIMLNTPSIPTYQALPAQVMNKANGNGSEKNVAIWLRDKYQERVAAFEALYNEQKTQTIQWSKH